MGCLKGGAPGCRVLWVALVMTVACSDADTSELTAVSVSGNVMGLGYSGEASWGNLEVGALSLSSGYSLGVATASAAGEFSLEVKVKAGEVVLFSALAADPASHVPLFTVAEVQPDATVLALPATAGGAVQGTVNLSGVSLAATLMYLNVGHKQSISSFVTAVAPRLAKVTGQTEEVLVVAISEAVSSVTHELLPAVQQGSGSTKALAGEPKNLTECLMQSVNKANADLRSINQRHTGEQLGNSFLYFPQLVARGLAEFGYLNQIDLRNWESDAAMSQCQLGRLAWMQREANHVIPVDLRPAIGNCKQKAFASIYHTLKDCRKFGVKQAWWVRAAAPDGEWVGKLKGRFVGHAYGIYSTMSRKALLDAMLKKYPNNAILKGISTGSKFVFRQAQVGGKWILAIAADYDTNKDYFALPDDVRKSLYHTDPWAVGKMGTSFPSYGQYPVDYLGKFTQIKLARMSNTRRITLDSTAPKTFSAGTCPRPTRPPKSSFRPVGECPECDICKKPPTGIWTECPAAKTCWDNCVAKLNAGCKLGTHLGCEVYKCKSSSGSWGAVTPAGCNPLNKCYGLLYPGSTSATPGCGMGGFSYCKSLKDEAAKKSCYGL